MQVTLAHIGTRSASRDDFQRLTTGYLDRCSAFSRPAVRVFRSEADLLDWLESHQARTVPVLVAFDRSGRQFTSEAFAEWIGKQRDQGAQHLVFAIGPADGWSATALGRAKLVLSLGAWTLPHLLARLVVAEQLYRAFTILSGHPYHCGH